MHIRRLQLSSEPMQHSTKQTPPANASRTRRARIRARVDGNGSEDGQALVEFALVLPIILILLLGIAWFGIALNDWINETQLTSEAARFAAVNQNPGEKEKKSLLEWIQAQGDNNQVAKEAKATICSPTSERGDWVEVKLTYMYKWLPIFQLAATETPLTSTAQMRIEVAPTTKNAKGEEVSTPYPKTC
jgi:Flp pilus assembly protein TadG